jgi:hypothetical protein
MISGTGIWQGRRNVFGKIFKKNIRTFAGITRNQELKSIQFCAGLACIAQDLRTGLHPKLSVSGIVFFIFQGKKES